MTESRALLENVLEVLLRHKAENLVVLEVGRLVGYTEYVVICSGQSDRQVRAIAEHIIGDMKKQHTLPFGVEGVNEAEWVLLDYNDVVVHVFQEAARDFYDLESLWRDAPRVPVQERPAAVAALR